MILSKPDMLNISRIALEAFIIENGMFCCCNFFCTITNTRNPELDMYSNFSKSKINESNLPNSSVNSFSKSGAVTVSIFSSILTVNYLLLYSFVISILSLNNLYYSFF